MTYPNTRLSEKYILTAEMVLSKRVVALFRYLASLVTREIYFGKILLVRQSDTVCYRLSGITSHRGNSRCQASFLVKGSWH